MVISVTLFLLISVFVFEDVIFVSSFACHDRGGHGSLFGLVQINPATNFAQSNALASAAARTGLLAAFSEPLYRVAQV